MPKLEVVNANNVIEFNPQKANFKLKNTGGPKGDTGAQGPQGPKGETGAQGPAGASASVTVGSTTTLSPGADATVTNSGDTRNAILNFGIPTGARGPKGDTGSKGDTGPIGPKGAKGDTGAAATVQVGNTNTGAPGTNAQVTNAGNEHFAVFNFTIPRGDKGEKGDTGAQGHKGDKGDKGDAGTAATITVGSTTTTNPGTNATVTNSGTTSAAVLNFGIPKGATGSVKSEVIAELPETGEEDTFYLVNREATEQTATGKAINFTNSDNAGDITDFKLDGETSQNGTPTPSAPVAVQTVTGENVVKICGKNLFDKNAISTGYLNADGTLSSDQAYKTSDFIAVKPNTAYSKTYTASPRTKYYNSTRQPLNTTTYQDISIGGAAGTFTTPANAAYVRFSFPVAGVNLDTTQLELGSTATAYEPYQGQSYTVNLASKNLFDKSAATDGYRLAADGTPYADYTFTLSAYIPVQPNTTYTVSYGSTIATGYAHVASYGSDKTFVYRWYVGAVSSFTFTTQANAYYVRLAIPIDNKNTTQCELGSTATIYADFWQIELCKIGTYQDSIYKSGGKWYAHKATAKATLTSTSFGGWQLTSSADGYIRVDTINNIGFPTNDGYCDKLTLRTGPHGSYEYIWLQPTDTGKIYIQVLASRVSALTQAAFDDWVNSAQPSVYYPLATPTDTEITNQALVAQLDNVASAPLYTGVNNITTITPNEQGTLEIKYVTYDKYNQNKVYIWNDTLQQWQIIVP